MGSPAITLTAPRGCQNYYLEGPILLSACPAFVLFRHSIAPVSPLFLESERIRADGEQCYSGSYPKR